MTRSMCYHTFCSRDTHGLLFVSEKVDEKGISFQGFMDVIQQGFQGVDGSDVCLFNENPRTYSAICTSNTLFLTLSRTNLLTIISECPTVAVSLLKCYTKAISCRQSYENT